MIDTFSLLQKYTGISKYSQSEVITPQNIVKDMVDLLPQEVFNPDATFFDPAVKSGRFLIEIYNRLMASEQMKQKFQNEQYRHKHIIHKQLYGFATSPTAAIVVRKALYSDPLVTGNIRFTSGKVTKESVQGAFNNMRFDVVIGNPPYNNDIYLDFVTLGHSLASQYTVMITPAKWQAKGGKKNVDFRKHVVPYMSKIVFYPCCYDVFTGSDDSDYPKIHSGVSYYLIVKDECNKKHIEEICKVNKELNASWVHDGKYIDTLYDTRIVNIIAKVQKAGISRLKISNNGMVGKNNVGICNMFSWGGFLNRQGETLSLISPYIWTDFDTVRNSMVLRTFDNADEANSLISYINTRFIRFLAFISCTSQNINNENTWRFVPDPGAFDHIFTDDELYKKYGLTPEEINIVESVIKERK